MHNTFRSLMRTASADTKQQLLPSIKNYLLKLPVLVVGFLQWDLKVVVEFKPPTIQTSTARQRKAGMTMSAPGMCLAGARLLNDG